MSGIFRCCLKRSSILVRPVLLKNIENTNKLSNVRWLSDNKAKNETNNDETHKLNAKKAEDNFNKEKAKFTRPGVGVVLRLKDFFDLIFYAIFGFAIYYAYKQYKKKDEFKKEIEAEQITIEKFKHHLYKIKEFILPDFIVNILKQIQNFEARKDDVWICSFPKSGTTWVQEITYLIMNNCDFETAKIKSIEERSPFLEFPYPGIKYVSNIKTPRIIKTHMPIDFLPDDLENKSKVIYVIRNPKDVAVSYHFFMKMLTEAKYDGEMNDSLEHFAEGKVPYGPWWKHVDGFVNKKNVFFLHYEELYKQPVEVIKSLCKFLGKELSEQQIHSIVDWCSFENMRNNPSVNYEWNKAMGMFSKDGEFFRKGKIGDWLNHFSAKQSLNFDRVITANLKNFDAKNFDYGISEDDLNKIYSNANLNLSDKKNE